MIQFTSSSASTYHFLTLFIILLVFINNHSISANRFSSRSDYEHRSPIYNDFSSEDIDDSESSILVNPNSLYTPDNEEIISQNPWSQLFHRYSDQSIYTPTDYSSPQSGYALRRGEIPYISYPAQKRAIPIEFKKALFAHGIVGRRR